MNLEMTKQNIFQVMNFAIVFLATSVFLISLILKSPYSIVIYGSGGYSLVGLLIHLVFKRKNQIKLAAHLYIINWLFFTSLMAYGSGGITGPMMSIYSPIPLIALIFLNRREAMAWTAGIIFILFSFTFVSKGENDWIYLLFNTVSVICVFVIGLIHYTFSERYRVETEKRALELSYAQAQLIQSAKLASLGEMSAGVAHEINNPLTIVNMRVHQIQRLSETGSLVQKDLLKYMGDIESSSKRITSIISDLRNFSKDTQNDVIVETDFASVVDSIRGLAEERLRYEGVKLEFFISNSPIYLECKKMQIAQVLMNLINNSFDAVKDLKEKWVRVEASQIHNEIIIRVKDSGKGIKKEIADKMMQPFFTTKLVGQGPGLGLSSAFGIVISHGGSIQLDHSCPNTCFVITLPIKQHQKEEVNA